MNGSSPLTRGKPVARPTEYDALRLIPAHAGKTVGAGLRVVLDRAHPRSRGENYATRRDLSRPTGSSPLTRGKLAAVNPTFATVRLIPAHAGKTPQNSRLPGTFAGSSPLTRGKQSA